MTTEGSGVSRAGNEILRNEDAFLVEDGLGLYVVCDGSSVAQKGEIASRLAVEALEEFIERAEEDFGESLLRTVASSNFADRAVRYAMNSVLRKGRSDPKLAGMTTTATMLLTHGKHGTIGHVGDSRAYLIRDGEIQQLTSDHEWTETTASEDGTVSGTIDAFSVTLKPGDTYVLCTDGAEHVIERAPEALRCADEFSPRSLASRLVSAAHLENPDQDATVVVVRVRGEFGKALLWLSDVPRSTSFGHAVSIS